MLRANNLIERDADDDDDDDDLDDLFETRKIDKEGKKLRNALDKNALNEVYDTDDEENPYLSDSDLEKPEEDDSIKKEKDENSVEIKQEDKDGLDSVTFKKESTNTLPKIYVKSARNGFVTLGATKEILKQFPKGEWNPKTAIKRPMPPADNSSQPPIKKIKIKLENGRSASATPEPGSSTTITKEDIDVLLNNGPVEMINLVRALKDKMSRDPNSRKVFKQIFKDHFVLKNKMVYRKK
ncbi:unnamed protein product [Ambrosiozyma monospora]|uniref:Unnamed protein product n=1 Tax=Ambrosiozyma monospora TaxID=43982 RepID=A0ACB5T846_AMBMO|nr:unnamed protein product [Ambrosiozyma monospora]